MESPRPKGTDGSDYAYRMTIDNRYKRAAEGRVRFRKFISAQALLQLLKATWACLAALNSEQPSMSLVASCGFGGAAVVVGTFAMKGSASKLLRAYIFFTAIAIMLSLVPLMSGQDTGKWKDSMEYFQVTGDYQRVVMASLKGLLELAGIVVQVLSVLTSISLLRNVSPPKRAE
ncbi:unnamed protein product [Sphagnum tenellum]